MYRTLLLTTIIVQENRYDRSSITVLTKGFNPSYPKRMPCFDEGTCIFYASDQRLQ